MINKSDKNMYREFPQELKRFNWGAFLMNWIWGVMHKKYITLLVIPAMLIPIIAPLALSIWFGFVGNRWAWESKNWSGIEEFNESQKMWIRLWLAMTIFVILLFVKVAVVLFFILAAIGQSSAMLN